MKDPHLQYSPILNLRAHVHFSHFEGTQFPLEVQLIHFKEDYGSMDEALEEKDGIAILVALFQVSLTNRCFENDQN